MTRAEYLDWIAERYDIPGTPNLLGDFDTAALAYFAEGRELMIRKEKDYGSTWLELGARGLYVYLQAKAGRLRRLLWLGEPAAVANESLRDTLIDLLNYVLMTLYCLDNDNWSGNDS